MVRACNLCKDTLPFIVQRSTLVAILNLVNFIKLQDLQDFLQFGEFGSKLLEL